MDKKFVLVKGTNFIGDYFVPIIGIGLLAMLFEASLSIQLIPLRIMGFLIVIVGLLGFVVFAARRIFRN